MRALIFAVFCVGSLAQAQAPTPLAVTAEVRAGSFVTLASEHDGTVQGVPASDAFRGQLNVGYGKFFSPQWEGLLDASISIVSGDASTQTYGAMLGAAYNFSEDTSNALYLAARVGPQYAKTASDHSYVAAIFSVSVGKRVALLPSVSWNPEIEVYSRTKATSRESANWERASYTSYAVMPLQFSLLF